MTDTTEVGNQLRLDLLRDEIGPYARRAELLGPQLCARTGQLQETIGVLRRALESSRRLAAKAADFAKELNENFLRQVFRLSHVTSHAQAE